MAATIKWLQREIERLKADKAADERQANRFQTQANYQESTQPELSYFSEQTADKYKAEADSIDGQIADYERQIADLNAQVGRLEEERDEHRRRADEIDREIVNLVG